MFIWQPNSKTHLDYFKDMRKLKQSFECLLPLNTLRNYSKGFIVNMDTCRIYVINEYKLYSMNIIDNNNYSMGEFVSNNISTFFDDVPYHHQVFYYTKFSKIKQILSILNTRNF